MHRGPPPPPPRPIHPIIPPALYDQSILFYTASHETSRPDGSTVPILRFLFLSFPSAIADAACLRLLFSHHFSTMPRNSFVLAGFSFPNEHPGRSSSPVGENSVLTSEFQDFAKNQPIGASFCFGSVERWAVRKRVSLSSSRFPSTPLLARSYYNISWFRWFCIREYVFRLSIVGTILNPSLSEEWGSRKMDACIRIAYVCISVQSTWYYYNIRIVFLFGTHIV